MKDIIGISFDTDDMDDEDAKDFLSSGDLGGPF